MGSEGGHISEDPRAQRSGMGRDWGTSEDPRPRGAYKFASLHTNFNLLRRLAV